MTAVALFLMQMVPYSPPNRAREIVRMNFVEHCLPSDNGDIIVCGRTKPNQKYRVQHLEPPPADSAGILDENGRLRLKLPHSITLHGGGPGNSVGITLTKDVP